MASILSKLTGGIKSEEEKIEEDFVFWWDDIEDEDYIIEERKSFRENLSENLVLVLHFLLALITLPLIITTGATNFLLAAISSVIIVALLSISYLIVKNRYITPHRILAENIGMGSDSNLTGNDELLFSTDNYQLLDDYNSFRMNMVNFLKTYQENSATFQQEIVVVQSMLNNVHRSIDQINLALDNTVASTANYQELKGYLGHISKGIDDFTVYFDSALDSIGEISNILRSIGKQTTMMALNAGIEAAKAGDKGKGFEVVASNLRRLAQHASDSSSRIASTSDEIDENARSALEQITTGMINLENLIDDNHSVVAEMNNELYTGVNDLNSVQMEYNKLFSLVEQNQAELEKFKF